MKRNHDQKLGRNKLPLNVNRGAIRELKLIELAQGEGARAESPISTEMSRC